MPKKCNDLSQHFVLERCSRKSKDFSTRTCDALLEDYEIRVMLAQKKAHMTLHVFGAKKN